MAFIDFQTGESDLRASTARRVASVLMPPNIGGDFERFVLERFGVLSAGAHEQDEGKACVLEAAAAWRGLWTDDPGALGVPDIRALNDAPWPDDQERTEQMTRLYEAVADWAEWSGERRARFAERVVLRTAREIVAEALWSCGGLEVDAAWLAAASDTSQVAARAEAAKRRAYSRYPACGYAYDAVGHVARAARAAADDDPYCTEDMAREAAIAAYYAAATYEEDTLARRAAEIWVQAAAETER